MRKLSSKDSAILSRHAEIMKDVYGRLKERGIPLHEGQIKLARDILNDGKRVVQAQWGRKAGKRLTLDTLLPTPDRGFVSLSDLKEGDFLFGPDGRSCKIVGLSPIEMNPELYRVRFSDGSFLDADAEHLWETTTKLTRRSIKKNKGKLPKRSPIQHPEVVNTKQIAETLMHGKEYNHAIKVTEPLELPRKDLPLDPYLLGVWLGDGSSYGGRITSADKKIIEEFEKLGFSVRQYSEIEYGVAGIHAHLNALNLIKNKHIPEKYLWGSVDQRIALVQGLMDTDGTIDKRKGVCEFSNTNKAIACGFRFLLSSLGVRSSFRIKQGKLNGVAKKLCYRIIFTPNIPVFRLQRKFKYQTLRKKPNVHTVVACEKIPPRPARCLEVDNDSHLFLAGETLIPTHNTETSLFISCVYALLNPGSQVWIICPQRKQGKDIYWVSGRLQKFLPEKYVLQEKETEITLELHNGSIVRVDGCENYPALRGINPDFVIYDEFQDHSKEFHVEVMAPNLVAKKASLLVIGTPPKRDCYYVEFRKQLLDEIEGGDETRAYYEFPSEINPSLDKEELEKIKQRLYKAGDEKIWLREHMAQLIYGGEGAVFSHWSRERHIKNHKALMSSLEMDMAKLKWFTIFDPGSTTCFAVLFGAYNSYTSQVFLLDEIYETNPRNTDALSIWRRAIEVEKELYPHHPTRTFRRIYDESAPWFPNNLSKFYRNDPSFYMSPTAKNKLAKYYAREDECSLIKQIMGVENTFYVSDRCKKFQWEVENYVLDEKGDYPKDHDHLIDSLIYLLKACNYKFIEDAPVMDIINSSTFKSHFGSKKLIALKDPSEWSDNVVEESLNVSPYDDYFH